MGEQGGRSVLKEQDSVRLGVDICDRQQKLSRELWAVPGYGGLEGAEMSLSGWWMLRGDGDAGDSGWGGERGPCVGV